MNELKFGDIVLIRFPYTNGVSVKKRPALVIFDSKDGDVIVCRVTSKLYNTSYDITLRNWQKFGLRLPSVIRIHKLASLEKELIESRMGQLDKSVQILVKRTLRGLLLQK